MDNTNQEPGRDYHRGSEYEHGRDARDAQFNSDTARLAAHNAAKAAQMPKLEDYDNFDEYVKAYHAAQKKLEGQSAFGGKRTRNRRMRSRQTRRNRSKKSRRRR